VLRGVTGVGRGNPVTGESAHNFGAISAPPHISPQVTPGSMGDGYARSPIVRYTARYLGASPATPGRRCYLSLKGCG
jgi:hypothetical protein